MKDVGNAFTTAPMVKAVWTDIAARLQQRLEPGHYKVWIEPLVGSFDGLELVVYAVSAFAAGFVRDNFLGMIREALTEVAKGDISIRVTSDPVPVAQDGAEPDAPGKDVFASVPSLVTSVQNREAFATAPLVAAPGNNWQPSAPLHTVSLQVSGQHALPLRYDEFASSLRGRSWRHSFDDFIVGPCNELAVAASQSMCRESNGVDILFLSSAPGLGKTHLIQATGQQLHKECNHRAPRVEYLTAEEFTSRLVMAFKTNDTERFKAHYRDVDVLLLEDVHFLQGKEKIQEELLSTVKTLQDRGSKVVFSSSFIPRDLQKMSGELLSRLNSGFLAVIDRPDKAMRKKILQEKAKLHQVLLPEDVSDFLADSIDVDIRQIESCLHNLTLKAKLLRSGITMQMAWEAVQYYAPCEKKLDLEKIITYVSQGYGISSEQMRSKSRKKNLVAARNTVFFLARKHTKLSLEEIGNTFGKGHSTVIKGITSLEREMSRETSLGRQIAGAIAIIERNGGIISPSL